MDLKIDTDEYDDEDIRQPSVSDARNHFKSNSVEKPKNPAALSSGMNTSQRHSNSTNTKSVLPAPPPLYKAPVNTFHGPSVFGSSANSSILARASGMNNNLLKKNMSMPKLQPIGAIRTSPCNEGNRNKTPIIPKPNMVSLMPKLKPSSYNQAVSSQQLINRTAKAILPKPPQLIMAPSAKSLINKNSFEHKPVVTPVVQKQQPQTTASSRSPQKQTATTSTSNNSSKTGKSAENLSLKGKFCFEVFKGQSEFFQPVIISHPKMLEQRLNRATSNNNNNQATTANKKSNLNSNGNSNGSSNGGAGMKSQEHEEQETINRPASKSHVV